MIFTPASELYLSKFTKVQYLAFSGDEYAEIIDKLLRSHVAFIVSHDPTVMISLNIFHQSTLFIQNHPGLILPGICGAFES